MDSLPAGMPAGSALPPPRHALGLRHRLLNRRRTLPITLFLTAVILLGLLHPWLTPYDPIALDLSKAWAPPTAAHPLGCDGLGRDVLSRLMAATGTSLLVAGIALAVTLAAGALLGFLSALSGRWTDAFIMRWVDIALAFPEIVVAILLGALLGPGEAAVIGTVAVAATPGTIRLVRASALAARQEAYVMAAVAVGASTPRIMLRHVFPAVLPLLVVRGATSFAFAVLSEAGLSFLGLGVPDPQPSWGNLLRNGLSALSFAPSTMLATAALLTATVLALNLLSDDLRDALDPRAAAAR